MSKKKKTSSAKQGPEAFTTYYQKFFPQEEEFQQFTTNLQTPTLPILRFNPENQEKLKNLWDKEGINWQISSHHKYALKWPAEIPLGTDLPGYKENLFYPMNASSLQPVLQLDPQPGETILDACAAPGGKALFISELIEKTGHLIANDLSAPRRNRMKKLFESHNTQNIEILNFKAQLIYRKYPQHFDRILVDAPCSSEKHVFNSPKHLNTWKPSRPKNLARTQYSLLSGLLQALKSGGTLVYSTCAITPEENEEVIKKFLKKKGDQVKLIKQTRIFAPHKNLDPMFIAKLQKKHP